MEESLIGYLMGSLEPDAHRQMEAHLAQDPDAVAKLDLLRQAIEPLDADKDTIDPPDDLALRTIGYVAEHIVAADGSVTQDGPSPVADFIRSLGKRDTSALKPVAGPNYPWHGSEANPSQFRARNLVSSIGLSAALLLIGVTAVMTFRQTRDIQACQNNMRVWNEGLNTYCDINNDRYPHVAANEPARSALVKLQAAGVMPEYAHSTCPATSNSQSDCGTASHVAGAAIDYAYTLGYRDENGQLWGLVRNAENDQYPILADAPERRNAASIPVNHRKGQNVLFAGGHVRFCTSPNVGPEIDGAPDDIFYNTAHEARAGTSRWDSVLGRANEQP